MHSEDPHLNAHEPAEEVKLFDRRSFLKAGAHAAVAVAAAGVAAQPLMGVSDPPSCLVVLPCYCRPARRWGAQRLKGSGR